MVLFRAHSVLPMAGHAEVVTVSTLVRQLYIVTSYILKTAANTSLHHLEDKIEEDLLGKCMWHTYHISGH